MRGESDRPPGYRTGPKIFSDKICLEPFRKPVLKKRYSHAKASTRFDLLDRVEGPSGMGPKPENIKRRICLFVSIARPGTPALGGVNPNSICKGFSVYESYARIRKRADSGKEAAIVAVRSDNCASEARRATN